MRVTEITPHTFRNLTPEPVSFATGVNVVAGENGQGKTNLLEALAVLCGQRSFRRALPSALAADGHRFAVRGILRRGFETEELRIEWSRVDGRRFFRGEKEISFRGASELAPAVFLSPEHRELVTGSPAGRRRFLDRLVLGLRPAAGDDLARFERALSERNALLSSGGSRSFDAPELDAWTEEFAVAGCAVRRHRREALAEWQRCFQPLSRSAGREYEEVEARYTGEGEDVVELKEECERLLPVEKRRGFSLAGPHRDDLVWMRRGRPLAREASAGEVTRTIALARLAEWHAVAKARGEPPLFGADDFDAGLSRNSVDAFLEALPDEAVVVLTTASDPASFSRTFPVIEMRAGSALPRRRAVNE